jgi:hypothetical protein
VAGLQLPGDKGFKTVAAFCVGKNELLETACLA